MEKWRAPEAEFAPRPRFAGVDPVGGEAPACAADGLRPLCRGDVGLLRTGDEDGVEGDDERGGERSSRSAPPPCCGCGGTGMP
jgi:hypothetical protein